MTLETCGVCSGTGEKNGRRCARCGGAGFAPHWIGSLPPVERTEPAPQPRQWGPPERRLWGSGWVLAAFASGLSLGLAIGALVMIGGA